MANINQKSGVFHVRFRFGGKQYKKSLKTRDRADARAALHGVEQTIHRLSTGQLHLPAGVDSGDFIISGGTLQPAAPARPPAPSTRQLVSAYLESQVNSLAESYRYSQGVHLRHLLKHLGTAGDQACDRLSHRDLAGYLEMRLRQRNPNTVMNERITLIQFCKWGAAQGFLEQSPAEKLPVVKGGRDLSAFRTSAEIQAIRERGGLSAEEELELWERLYLTLPEISGLLRLVRTNASRDFAYLLHAIPAYTGMRRGEMLRLRWNDVDFAQGYIYARSRKQSRKKTETIRQIDLHPELNRQLREWREQRKRGQLVVCSEDLQPVAVDLANRCFWQPLRGSDWCLDGKKNRFKLGFHTYRHSFASNLAAAGVDQRVIDEWMGHQTEAMRKRYRHLFPSQRRSAIMTFSLEACEI
jgi:integrase